MADVPMFLSLIYWFWIQSSFSSNDKNRVLIDN